MKTFHLGWLTLLTLMVVIYLAGFVSGYTYVSDDYVFGVPPAPPFTKQQLTFRDQPGELCSIGDRPVVGYVIKAKGQDKGMPDNYVLIQDEYGVRESYYFSTTSLSNALDDYPSLIFIPGVKVKMRVEYCGSSGAPSILEVETLPR